MKLLINTLFLLLSISLFGQVHSTCDDLRYRTEIFTNTEATYEIKFGEGVTIGGETQELFMDVYQPLGDVAEKRPVIILAFGGSFIVGQREDIDWLCEAYAKRGFVAVTIDYRLYDLPWFPLPTEEEMMDVVAKAVSDMKAAIRFLREDADTDDLFRIDPDYIFVGGISAGGITANHTAVLDSTDVFTTQIQTILNNNGGMTGNSSTNTQYSTEVKGVVNYSGGLHDASWIDENDPPFISFHDDGDGTVPYGAGYANILFFDIVYVEGSLIMHQEGNSLGVYNKLNTYENSQLHVGYFVSQEDTDEVIDSSTAFLHDLICPSVLTKTTTITSTFGLKLYPNPVQNQLNLRYAPELKMSFCLRNSLGQSLGYWENTTQIDLSNYPEGIYFLEAKEAKTGSTTVKKLMVKH